MKILFAASEAVPFIKSGGLADVAGALSKALKNRRQACRVVMPLYDDIDPVLREDMKFCTSFFVQLGWRSQYCGIFESTVDGVKYYFLDNEYYFKRRGIYGFYDDAERFAFFDMAVLEMLSHIDFVPDVIHCNDWQTALIPVYLNVFYRGKDRYRNIKTVFTIHNIQYQGIFDKHVGTDVLGLPDNAMGIITWGDTVNFMKGAIEEAEALTTVSPTYAKEILDPWYAHGLDSLLQQKQYKLSGILNGLDTDIYDPATDSKIPHNYTTDKLQGKAANKKELQRSLGLKEDKNAMIISMVTRLVGHKGLDLLQNTFDQIMDNKVQFVLLGAGEWNYERFLKNMEVNYPGRVSVTLGYDGVLAHSIYAGSDLFLMPSKSEPCGLSQMIALRYGTIPVVRLTGGLKDTVGDLWGEDGCGYTFLTYNAEDMLATIGRAIQDYKDKKKWAGHVENAMKRDFGWGKSANAYIALYKEITK